MLRISKVAFFVVVVGLVFVISLSAQKIQPIAEIEASVSSIAFSPNGELLAFGSFDDTVKFWDIATKQFVNALEGHEHYVASVAFSPDGKLIASGSGDETIKLWDVKTRGLVTTFTTPKTSIWNGTIEPIAFSPDGKLLAVGVNNDNFCTVKLWDIKSGQCIAFHETRRRSVYSIAFSPDGKLLAVGLLWSGVSLFRIDEYKEDVGYSFFVDEVLWPERGVDSLAFSPDGKLLAATSGGTIKFWDMETRNAVATLEGHEGGPTSIAFSPDGKLLLSGSDDKTVRLWNVATRKCVANLIGNIDWNNCVAFSPNGKLVAFGTDWGNRILLWDISSVGKEDQPNKPNVPGQAVNPQGKLATTWGEVKK